MHAILVFADGACTGNPGPGGWGVIIAYPDGKITELGGFASDTTNNKMELTAVGKALRHLEKTPGEIQIYTDSTYVIRGITQWIWGWRKNGWKTAEGKEVANAEYWKQLQALLAARDKTDSVEWKYVRGHSGVAGNERVDEIAVAFAKGQRPRLYSGTLLKYDVPIHDIPDEAGELPEMKPKKTAEEKKAYSYLSLVGRKLERHSTWKECEARVKGVPGAKFKKCKSESEEKAVLASWGVSEDQ